jgi:hypothetical protein
MGKPGPPKNPKAHEIEIRQQKERRVRDSIIREVIADEVAILMQELKDERRLYAESQAAERRKLKAVKSKRDVKVQNPQKPIAVEISASGERIEILARELPGEIVYVPLDPRLADKVEKEEDMQKLPRNALLNRFMGNKFKGKNYLDEIHYGIIVEYIPLLNQYLVAYDDRTYNFVSWASLCRYIIKVGHMEKTTMDLLKTCLETEDYKTYNRFT